MTSLRTAGDTAGARPSRRTALRLGMAGGLAGAAALAGCSLNNPLGDEKTPAAEAVRDLAPDVAVAVEAATMIRSMRTAVATTAERHPRLSAGLSGLLVTHDAHLGVVVEAVPDGVDTSAAGPAYAVPAGVGPALTALTGAERTLHDGLVGLALRAESGPFARLLGSMAAALAQQLHGLAA